MKSYKYQMHAHTLPCSACSKITPTELVDSLHKGGFSGCVITNHFMGGNTGIDRKLPWEEFVRAYELDYLELKGLAAGYDMDILFGVEQHVGGGLEILCYGVTPEMLYAHPELADKRFDLWYNVMHSYGVICVQAHPFRERDYIPEPKALPVEFIDGIEVYNAGNSYESNRDAEIFAEKYPHFILISGADTHYTKTACLGGIETTQRIRNDKELIEVLKTNNYTLIK